MKQILFHRLPEYAKEMRNANAVGQNDVRPTAFLRKVKGPKGLKAAQIYAGKYVYL
jgi:hypothetical protein